MKTSFKTYKMHESWAKPIVVPWTRKGFPIHLNGVLEMYPSLCTIFHQNYQNLPNVHVLSFSYLVFWATLVLFHFICPNRALVALIRIFLSVMDAIWLIFAVLYSRQFNYLLQNSTFYNYILGLSFKCNVYGWMCLYK